MINIKALNCERALRKAEIKVKALLDKLNGLEISLAESEGLYNAEVRKTTVLQRRINSAEAQLEVCAEFSQYYRNELTEATKRIRERDKENAELETQLAVLNSRMGSVISLVGESYAYYQSVSNELKEKYEDIDNAPAEDRTRYTFALGALEVTTPLLDVVNSVQNLSNETPTNPDNIDIA